MPRFVRAVIPMLVCADAAAEIEFCKAAFCAAELSRREDENGDVTHATLGIGELLIMVHAETAHFGKPRSAERCQLAGGDLSLSRRRGWRGGASGCCGSADIHAG
jgi:uncharacterized glyoxalase superfamily protein PhnB